MWRDVGVVWVGEAVVTGRPHLFGMCFPPAWSSLAWTRGCRDDVDGIGYLGPGEVSNCSRQSYTGSPSEAELPDP